MAFVIATYRYTSLDAPLTEASVQKLAEKIAIGQTLGTNQPDVLTRLKDCMGHVVSVNLESLNTATFKVAFPTPQVIPADLAMLLSNFVPRQWQIVEGDALAWGVVIGGLLQAAVLLPSLSKLGFLPKLRGAQWGHSGVWKIWRNKDIILISYRENISLYDIILTFARIIFVPALHRCWQSVAIPHQKKN